MTIKVKFPPELDREGLAVVEEGGRAIVLLRVEDQYRAIDRDCPHEQGNLGEGLMFGKHIKCPLHGFIFDLTDGRCLNQRGYSSQVYDVKLDGDWVVLEAKGLCSTAESSRVF